MYKKPLLIKGLQIVNQYFDCEDRSSLTNVAICLLFSFRPFCSLACGLTCMGKKSPFIGRIYSYSETNMYQIFSILKRFTKSDQ